MLTNLNQAQRCAVDHDGSHLLIVAGPGTGKTRTLVCRIARLAGTLSATTRILAITFTNKASDEMRDRLETFGPDVARRVVAGTFHFFSLRLLREYCDRLSFPLNFSIVTPDEVEALAAEFRPEASRRERRQLLVKVSAWKAALESKSADADVNAFTAFLRERGLVDFDDILRDAVLLLRDNPDIAVEVRRHYPFVMVDEYQDVNAVQVELLKLLTSVTPGVAEVRLTVIGDPNQAIYGFRGSEVRFFEDFENTFTPCRRLELEENYRSAENLLEASCRVVAGSAVGASFRVPELTAHIHARGLLAFHEATSDKAEAVFVAREIAKLIGGSGHHAHDIDGLKNSGGYSFSDIAVLFRLNAQARAFEDALAKDGIPFQTAGVKPAGLGLETRRVLRDLRDVADLSLELEKRRAKDEALDANWESVTALAGEVQSVTEFLDRLSLTTPEDAYTAKAEKVALLTLHAAKGLEFPVVFIVGCEEGLLPLNVDFLETNVEEECRLFYVGMTRAKERLYFTRVRGKRMLFGQSSERPASSFLEQIRRELEMVRGRELSRKRIQEKEQMKLF